MRFAQRVAQLQQQVCATPAARAPFTPTHQALDAVTFAHWLNTENFSDPHLRWYLDYCCRDDFGAGHGHGNGLGWHPLLRQPPRLPCTLATKRPNPKAR